MKSWLWLLVALYLALVLMGCATGTYSGPYNEDSFQPYGGKPYWYLNEAG